MKLSILSLASCLALVSVAACSGGTTSSGGAPVSTVDVSPSTCAVSKGNSQQFTAQAVYTDGSKADVSKDVTWTSSSTNVATVDGDGNMVAVAIGAATITASIGGKSGSAGCVVGP